MKPLLEIAGQALSLAELTTVAHGEVKVALASAAYPAIDRARDLVEKTAAMDSAVYGVNTGFGKLSDVRIEIPDLRQLQLNLIRSHACGVGPALPDSEVRGMMLLRANALAAGYSGVRPVVIETFLLMLNRGLHPVVPEKGSVGASGDLAPLAHLALVLIGEGVASYGGTQMPGAQAMRQAEIEPLILEPKEGLALLNGTQALASVGGLALHRAQRLVRLADVSGAMTLEALRGTPAAFDPRIQAVRPHPGQIAAATHLRELLGDSEIRESHRSNDSRVQDAYSLRCMPQVHGAVRDVLDQAQRTVEIETGAATDNPLVFAESQEMLSGGNFHGAPLAFAFDVAAIPLTSLIAICERRVDRLVNPDLNEGLPAFLTDHPGTCSGFMIAQVTVAALLNEARVLAHPASIDNVPTSGGKEDHVSMGMTAAVKLRKIVENLEYAVAIELLCAAQGLEYRLPLRPGNGAARAFAIVRSHVPRLGPDRALAPDMEALASAIRRGEFDAI